MDQLLLLYYKYKTAILNVVLLASIGAAVFVKGEIVRSVFLGVAFGLALINAGESIGRCAKRSDKTGLEAIKNNLV